VSNVALPACQQLRRLKQLALHHTGITGRIDAGLQGLRQLGCLTYLGLCGCRVEQQQVAGWGAVGHSCGHCPSYNDTRVFYFDT
jgi:hypothetical protein